MEIDYKDLVDVVKIRSSIRRMFNGDAREVISELLQNSQRADSKHVSITTKERGEDLFVVTYQDDGHGLKYDRESFYYMLRLGSSEYDASVISQQNPMGIGLHALFAIESVSGVTITSNKGLTLTVDTKRWWEDQNYYENWADRVTVQESDKDLCGVRISIICNATFVQQIRTALPIQIPGVWDNSSVANRYSDYFDVHLNGNPVLQNLELANTYISWKFDLKIEEADISVYRSHRHESTRICIDWFGQEVTFRLNDDFRSMNINGSYIFIKIRKTAPFDMRSPSREGPIDNEKWRFVISTIEDRIFEYVLGGRETPRIDKNNILWIYEVNRLRAERKSPYFLGRLLEVVPRNAYVREEESLTQEFQTKLDLFEYDDENIIVINNTVMVYENLYEKPITEEEFYDTTVGVEFLAGAIPGKRLCLPQACNSQRRPSLTLYLIVEHPLLTIKYGSSDIHPFYLSGKVGVSENDLPTKWFPIDCETHGVFLAESSVTGPFDASFVGITDDAQELLSNRGRLLADINDSDFDYDYWDNSTDECIRLIRGNSVPEAFTRDYLLKFFELPKEETIKSVEYIFEDSPSNHSIRVNTVSGKSQILEIY